MMKMIKYMLCLLLSIAILGCGGPKEETRLVLAGDAAPEFGAAEAPDWASFLEGSWASWDGVPDPDRKPETTYTFDRNGGVVIKNGRHEVGGKWTAHSTSITIDYETLNGQPFMAALQDAQKKAEGGTAAGIKEATLVEWLSGFLMSNNQLSHDNTKKKLVYGSGPSRAQEGFLAMIAPSLERVRYEQVTK
jgi:hypothetical protein